MNKKILITLLLTGLAPLAAHANTIIEGRYTTTTNTSYQPLMIVSDSKVQNWSALSVANLPTLASGAWIKTSCSGNTCMAAGVATDSNKDYQPLVAASTDQGSTWTYTAIPTASIPKFKSGYLPSISCGDKICVAAGNYSDHDATSLYQAMAFFTADQGQTWSLISGIDGFPSARQTILGDVNCHGSTCIIPGALSLPKQSHFTPFFVTSNDDGHTWTYKTVSGLPANFATMSNFLELRCSKNNCVISENYFDAKKNLHPLLIQSQDDGQTWQVVTSIYQEPKLIKAELYTTACNDGNSCIAFGTGVNAANKSVSYVLNTADGGATWYYYDMTSMIDPTAIGLVSSACKGNVCLLASTLYYVDSVSPVILLSQDAGKTWVHTVKPILPKDIVEIDLSSASISKGGYIVAGSISYMLNDYHATSPFLLTSYDWGRNWSMIDLLEFIPDLVEGEFYGSLAGVDSGSTTGTGQFVTKTTAPHVKQ